jgi:hypothetical protein
MWFIWYNNHMGKAHHIPEEKWAYTPCECGCEELVAQKRTDRVARFILGHQNRLKDWGTQEERFWKKVDRRGDDECWPWTGANSGRKERRGVIWFNGRREKAPKVSLIISGRATVEELDWALHSCDNANCVNPNHLRWGNRKKNHEDKISRGRNLNGSPTSREVRVLRRLSELGVQLQTLEDAFEFDNNVIRKVLE